MSDSTRILQVFQSVTGSGIFSNLGDAVAAAQPGNVIEFIDSSTCSAGDSGLIINTNSQGLPLHGLTIRAAAGKTPVISVPGSATGIMIVGRNITVQNSQFNSNEAAGIALFSAGAKAKIIGSGIRSNGDYGIYSSQAADF